MFKNNKCDSWSHDNFFGYFVCCPRRNACETYLSVPYGEDTPNTFFDIISRHNLQPILLVILHIVNNVYSIFQTK